MDGNYNLSILIPAYNNTESLIRVLESVKKQTIANELIILISDDCSPTPIDFKKINIFKDYFYKLITTRQEENLGVLTNPAWLFNQVETRFFTILQHDDVLIRKDFYEDAIKKLLENDNLVCYFGNSVIVRSKDNPKLVIDKNDPKYNLMLKFNSPLIRGLKDDNTMSGEDFIDNITNQYTDFNTAWSAIIFNTKATRSIGGFGGNYALSWFEAKSLNVYREEECFACLFLLCFKGDIMIEENPSVIRCLEPTSFSELPTHPVRKMRQDGEIFVLFKLIWIAEKLFNSKSADNIMKMIYKKCSKLPLREESKATKLFFKTYFPINKERRLIAIDTIKSSRSLKSPFELFYKIKGILRYYRNVYREKKLNKRSS